MSSTIIKLIDKSIFPAALLIVSKVFGLFLVVKLFNLEWQVNFTNNSIIGVYPVVFERDLVLVSSFSDAFMLFTILSGYTFTIISALLFHNTHINPRWVVKLASINLLGLIKDSMKVYKQSSIWFIFSFLAFLVSLYNSVLGKTHFLVPLIAFLIIVGSSVLLINDLEEEIERRKKSLAL